MKMRWWLLWFGLAGLVLGPLLARIPGFVVVVVGRTSLEVPLWLVSLGALVSGLLLWLLAMVSLRTSVAYAKTRGWMGGHRWRAARRSTIQGMIAYAEGNWSEAEKKMLKAVGFSDTRLINYLMAAEAAQRQGATERRDDYLRLAKDVAPEADIAIGLTQARAQLRSGQLEQSLATLNMLQQMAPKNRHLLAMLARVNRDLSDWPALMAMLPLLEKQQALTEEKLQQAQKESVCGVIDTFLHQQDLPGLRLFWKGLGKRFRKLEFAQLHYSAALCQLGDSQAAEPLLKGLIKTNQTPQALQLYSELDLAKPLTQLCWLETFKKREPENLARFAALARIAMRAHLWGKAKDYLKALTQAEPRAHWYAELAAVLEQLGEQEEAQLNYSHSIELLRGTAKAGLRLTAKPLSVAVPAKAVAAIHAVP